MLAPEIRQQIFATAEQWQSGLPWRLRLGPDGLTLFPAPTFAAWLEGTAAAEMGGLAADACGQLYWTERRASADGARWSLYRYDPGLALPQRLICLGRCGCPGDEAIEPGRMVVGRDDLWIVDRHHDRVLAFSTENFQLQYRIEPAAELLDLASDGECCLYLLVRGEGGPRVVRYDHHGRPTAGWQVSFGPQDDPVALVVGPAAGGAGQAIYVVDRGHVLHAVGMDGGTPRRLADWTAEPQLSGARPISIAAGGERLLFVLFELPAGGRALHQFDVDGSHLGRVSFEPELFEELYLVAAGPRGAVFLATDKGIARFDLTSALVGESGTYFSKTLDNGEEGRGWHRLELTARLPEGTSVDVAYHAADDAALASYVNRVLADPNTSEQEKKQKLEGALRGKWSSPEVFRGAESQATDGPHDLLFLENRGRYLWLRLKLSTFHRTNRPAIRRMRVFHPRLSYLRYLPATYQEDPVSRSFLERYLSLFETLFWELEVDIEQIPRIFDPRLAAAGFLPWLGRWLGLAIEEEWPEAKKRALLARAADLFRRKGTPAGLQELLELYTGVTVRIFDAAGLGRPLVLHRDPFADSRRFRLGVDAILLATPVRGFALGDESILGRTALRAGIQEAEDPFLGVAHRFVVLIDLTPKQLDDQRPRLERLIAEHQPAHTRSSLIAIGEASIGSNAYLEINSRITDFRPWRLGVDGRFGRSLALVPGKPGGRIERNSVLGGAVQLI